MRDGDTIRSDRLSNGMLLFSERMPGIESIAVGVWADAGSADESPEEFGAAHFLEHMLFKGTATRSAYQLAAAIENVGGHIDAFTEREVTHLYARALAEHLPIAVGVMADMVCHSAFAPDEFERERQVILEEIYKYDAMPDERVHDLAIEGLWPGSGLGHAILGTAESAQRLLREQVMDCRRRHLAAEHMLIAAAGRVDHDRLREVAEEAFADLPLSGQRRPSVSAGPSVPLRVVEEDVEQVYFCWAGRAYPARDDRNFALAILDAGLGASATSRLFQEIRERRGLAYDITSFTMGFREHGLFAVAGSVVPARFPAVAELLREEISRLRREGISPDELARAKEQMKAGLALSLESATERMQRLASHYLTWGQIRSQDELVARFNAVTLGAVREIAEEVLALDSWAFTAIGPITEAEVAGAIGARACEVGGRFRIQ